MNKDYVNLQEIPQEKFTLVQEHKNIYDEAIKTKSISYFGDALRRFVRNKASVAATIIILLIVVFALIAPFLTKYKVSDVNGVYAKARPKIKAFERTGFWDGSKTIRSNEKYLIYLNAISMATEDYEGKGATWKQGLESEYSVINKISDEYMAQGRTYRDVAVDSYYLVGFSYINITDLQYENIRKWEKETGKKVIYPMVNRTDAGPAADDANYWFKLAENGTPLDENDRPMDFKMVQKKGLSDNYLRDENGDVMYYTVSNKTMRQVRVLNYNYYIYQNGFEPVHYFGSDAQGYDIFIRVAQGTRLSLALAVLVSIVNLTVGALYGAVQGYYGGAIDLILDRITDIISGMPFMVIATLFQLHLVIPGKVSTFAGILFAFVLQGWIGTAARVRTQFYRFKNEEYILSARSMGAGDARLMFRHIFPNAIGTIITSSVLVIPGVILSESSLSYLGIVNFNSKNLTSLGTLLGNGQGYLATDPHILFVPAVIISLLMISFNLFGNGLRDAFNPALRGSEE